MPVTEKKLELRQRLREIWDHDDFVMGISGGLKTDDQIDELMEYIDAWEEQQPEGSSLRSDIALAVVFIRNGEGHLLYEEA